jgi:hypothetical protein
MDAYSRRIVGWSIAPHIRTELVLDALGMAVLRRTPQNGETILHSDHGSQYTSWAFGQRLQRAGLLGSMGSVGDCYDNAMMESFWGTLQLEVLDRKTWNSRAELANAIFEWIECWYNPNRAIPASECSVRSTTNSTTPRQIRAVETPNLGCPATGGSSATSPHHANPTGGLTSTNTTDEYGNPSNPATARHRTLRLARKQAARGRYPGRCITHARSAV